LVDVACEISPVPVSRLSSWQNRFVAEKVGFEGVPCGLLKQ